MAVRLSVPSQVYSADRVDTVLAIPATERGIKVTLTRESWPAGNVVRVFLIGRKDGIEYRIGPVVLAGGTVTGRGGATANVSVISWGWPGQAKKDAQGEYEFNGHGDRIREEIKVDEVDVELRILQPIRTAITVETY